MTTWFHPLYSSSSLKRMNFALSRIRPLEIFRPLENASCGYCSKMISLRLIDLQQKSFMTLSLCYKSHPTPNRHLVEQQTIGLQIDFVRRPHRAPAGRLALRDSGLDRQVDEVDCRRTAVIKLVGQHLRCTPLREGTFVQQLTTKGTSVVINSNRVSSEKSGRSSSWFFVQMKR